MTRFHEYYWLSLCRCSWLVGDVYVQKMEYCMRKCMVACSYTIPPPSFSQGLHDHPLSSSPCHVHTIVLLLALKYFLFQLGMMIRAVWHEINCRHRVKEGGGRQFVQLYLVSSTCFSELGGCFFLASYSALYTWYRGEWMPSTSRIHWDNNFFHEKSHAIFLCLYVC